MEEVHSKCKVCQKFAKVSPHPKIGTGLHARFPNRGAALDVTHVKLGGRTYDLQHMVDLFSKYSLTVLVSGSDAKGTL